MKLAPLEMLAFIQHLFPVRELTASEIRAMMRHGVSTLDIAQVFHIHESKIWNALAQADHPGGSA